MEIGDHEIEQFTAAVKSVSGYDFTEYSIKSLKRRLAKVLLDGSNDLAALISLISSDPEILEQTVRDITVNTTELFRDPPIWHSLRFDLLPRFADREQINIWHAGCSTGQEVYSMMILLHQMDLFDKTNIYASDLNTDVLDIARKGIYKYRFNIGYLDNFDKVIKENPQDSEDYHDVPYSDYFQIEHTNDQIIFNPNLVEKPVFKKMDLVHDLNPFEISFDMIICRNVIIYFNYDLQNRVFKLFYDNLNNYGCLILGVHETILGSFASKFDRKNQTYCKK